MYSQQEPTSAVATTAQSSIRGPAKSPPITIDGSRPATLQRAGWNRRNDLPRGTGLRPTSESILGISQDPLTAPSHRGSHQYGPIGGLARRAPQSSNPRLPFRQAGSPGRLGSPTVSPRFRYSSERPQVIPSSYLAEGKESRSSNLRQEQAGPHEFLYSLPEPTL